MGGGMVRTICSSASSSADFTAAAPSSVKNQSADFIDKLTDRKEGLASDQENCSDFLMSAGCDDENEYGAVPVAQNLSSLNS